MVAPLLRALTNGRATPTHHLLRAERARDILPPMRLLVPMLLVLLGGCQNSCQQICGRMAKFAEGCGHTVPQEQVQACIEAQISQV